MNEREPRPNLVPREESENSPSVLSIEALRNPDVDLDSNISGEYSEHLHSALRRLQELSSTGRLTAEEAQDYAHGYQSCKNALQILQRTGQLNKAFKVGRVSSAENNRNIEEDNFRDHNFIPKQPEQTPSQEPVSLEDLKDKVDIKLLPTFEEIITQVGSIEGLEQDLRATVANIEKELTDSQFKTMSNHFSPDLLKIYTYWHAMQGKDLDEEPQIKKMWASLSSQSEFLKAYLPNLSHYQKNIFSLWADTLLEKTRVPSILFILKKPSNISGKVPRDTIYLAAGEDQPKEWICIKSNDNEEVLITKEVLDAMHLSQNKSETGYDSYYHGTSSAALEGIGRHKALLSRTEQTNRNEPHVAGERADLSPRVYAYTDLWQSQVYARSSWFNEYPITIHLDRKKIQREAYAPDHGTSLGNEVPIEAITAIYAPTRNSPELQSWVEKNAPGIKVRSYEAAAISGRYGNSSL